MTNIYFNGGDEKTKVKTLTIHQDNNYMSYEVETESGYIYRSPLFKKVK